MVSAARASDLASAVRPVDPGGEFGQISHKGFRPALDPRLLNFAAAVYSDLVDATLGPSLPSARALPEKRSDHQSHRSSHTQPPRPGNLRTARLDRVSSAVRQRGYGLYGDRVPAAFCVGFNQCAVWPAAVLRTSHGEGNPSAYRVTGRKYQVGRQRSVFIPFILCSAL